VEGIRSFPRALDCSRAAFAGLGGAFTAKRTREANRGGQQGQRFYWKSRCARSDFVCPLRLDFGASAGALLVPWLMKIGSGDGKTLVFFTLAGAFVLAGLIILPMDATKKLIADEP
jgi:hypothetical protein